MYEGITFWAKRAPNTIGKLTIKLPDGNTDPDGQICSDCFNDYGYAVNVGEQWQRFVLPFNDLKQEPDWGVPRKPHIDRKRIYAIHFEAKVPGADYDFFIDDIAFDLQGLSATSPARGPHGRRQLGRGGHLPGDVRVRAAAAATAC